MAELSNEAAQLLKELSETGPLEMTVAATLYGAPLELIRAGLAYSEPLASRNTDGEEMVLVSKTTRYL